VRVEWIAEDEVHDVYNLVLGAGDTFYANGKPVEASLAGVRVRAASRHVESV